MLTLYYKESCPYCQRVLGRAQTLGISFDLKDATQPTVKDELIAHGGKSQVPYLIDTDTNTALYESGDIIAYLEQTVSGTQKAQNIRLHKSDSSCDTCTV